MLLGLNKKHKYGNTPFALFGSNTTVLSREIKTLECIRLVGIDKHLIGIRGKNIFHYFTHYKFLKKVKKFK